METSELPSSTNEGSMNHPTSGIVYNNTGNILKYQSPKRKRNVTTNSIKKSNISSNVRNNDGKTLDHQLLESPNGSLILGLQDHNHNHNYDNDNNNILGCFNAPVSLSFAPSTSYKSKYNSSMSACNTTAHTTILNSSYGNSIISTPSSPSGPNKFNINNTNHETSIDISHNSIQTEEISTISPVSSIASYAKYDEYDNSDVHETSGIAGIHALRSSVRSSQSSQSSHQSSGINTSSEIFRPNKLDASMNSSTSTSTGISIFSNFRVTNLADHSIDSGVNQLYNNAISPKLSDFSPNRNNDNRPKGISDTVFKSIDNAAGTGAGSLGTVLRNSAIARSCRSSCEEDEEDLHHNDMIDDDEVSNEHQVNPDGTVVRTRLRFTPLLRNVHHETDIDTNSPNSKNREDNDGAMAGQMSGLHLRSKKVVNDSLDDYSMQDSDHDSHNSSKSPVKLNGNILFMDTVSVSSTDDNDGHKGPHRTRALSLDMYERSTSKSSKSQQLTLSQNNSFNKGVRSDARYPRIQGMQAAEMGDLGTPLSAKSASPMIYMDTDVFIDDSHNSSGAHDYIDQLSSFISTDSGDECQHSNTKNSSKEEAPRRRTNRSESLGHYPNPQSSLSKGSQNRPLPDQSAFDKSITSNGKMSSPSQSPVCPATPMRTPTWAHEVEAKDVTNRITALGNPGLARQNSLVSNKLLLTQADSSERGATNMSADIDVSFTRDFENHGLLGSGTFADVYRVSAVDGSGFYAVKKSRRQFRSKKDREWLLSEVRVMKRLGVEPCANIVQLIKAWQEQGYFYVQIDLAEKGTLKDLMIYLHTVKRSISDDTIWKIMHDASSGLQHIHKFGMVHLDVKPANLLIAEGGVVKIGDFGMTTEQGRGDDGHEGDTIYMAPELLDSCDRFPPADIFSLGLTLYELCMTDGRLENYSLPSEGISWHALREGRAECIPNRSPVLCSIIQEKMIFPSPLLRPTSSQLLALPEVKAMKDVVDPLLNNAQPMQLLRRRTIGSSSFNPILARDLGLNIHANLNLVNPGDVASMRNDDRVRTPTASHGGTPQVSQANFENNFENKQRKEFINDEWARVQTNTNGGNSS